MFREESARPLLGGRSVGGRQMHFATTKMASQTRPPMPDEMPGLETGLEMGEIRWGEEMSSEMNSEMKNNAEDEDKDEKEDASENENDKTFVVNVYTLARDVGDVGPLPLWIKKSDTPAKIRDNFKEEYGSDLEGIMLEPDRWSGDEDPEVAERSFCHRTCCSRKENFVLDENMDIEVGKTARD